MKQQEVRLNAPSTQDTDGTANFVIAADNRVKLSLFSESGEVNSVLLQGIEALLSTLGFDATITPRLLDGSLQGGGGQVVLLQNALY